MPMGVNARQDRRTARRTQRGRAECVLEPHPFLAEPIDVRRLEMLVPGEAHGVPALIIGDDDDDVGLLAPLLGVGESWDKAKYDGDEKNAKHKKLLVTTK